MRPPTWLFHLLLILGSSAGLLLPAGAQRAGRFRKAPSPERPDGITGSCGDEDFP